MYLSMDIAVRIQPSVIPNEWKKYICMRQPPREMVFFSLTRLESILGMVVVVYQISRKDNTLMKKYMGVWSLESVAIRKSRVVLPSRPMMNTVAMRKNRTRWGPV